MRGLTNRQKRFAEEYLIDLNATKSAIRAGYSENGASVIACKLLVNANIQAKIQENMNERAKRTGITADRVLNEIAKPAFANMSDYVKWGNGAIAIRSSNELTNDQTACVLEISETSNEVSSKTKIKLHDKIKSLELLGRHLKLFTDKTEVTGKNGEAIEFRELSEPERNNRIIAIFERARQARTGRDIDGIDSDMGADSRETN